MISKSFVVSYNNIDFDCITAVKIVDDVDRVFTISVFFNGDKVFSTAHWDLDVAEKDLYNKIVRYSKEKFL